MTQSLHSAIMAEKSEPDPLLCTRHVNEKSYTTSESLSNQLCNVFKEVWVYKCKTYKHMIILLFCTVTWSEVVTKAKSLWLQGFKRLNAG